MRKAFLKVSFDDSPLSGQKLQICLRRKISSNVLVEATNSPKTDTQLGVRRPCTVRPS